MLVALIGYRGSGKSAVAQQLGLRLGWDWVDADVEIELRAGKAIAGFQLLTRVDRTGHEVAALGEPDIAMFADRAARVFKPFGEHHRVRVDLLHGAVVQPIEPSEPAFPNAALAQLEEGLAEDETASLDFIADRAGQYMIACGVPGHAQAGMWLQLAVSNGLKVPAYR